MNTIIITAEEIRPGNVLGTGQTVLRTTQAEGRPFVTISVDHGIPHVFNRTGRVFVQVRGDQGCIVQVGVDGPTLWDCECRECRSIARQGRIDSCDTCGGTGAVYDPSYGCDCQCPDCSEAEDTFEGALWRATAPKAARS